MAHEVGSVVEGKVVSVMPFGAFVELEDGVNGLVHISEISTEYVQAVADHLKVGDVVKAKVVKIDENGKISLSIKKRMLDEQKANRRSRPPRPQGGSVRPAEVDSFKSDTSDMSFEDLLSKFKSDSDEKQQALRRNSDSKLRTGYKRF
ncbi:MAG: S1 RNA-binding domain-containing protein [Clostridia bacterium]|nr:S1 RNA-binding domain-containing protein [Clostridia bacterium]